jgi:alanyl-tRNA synthetase
LIPGEVVFELYDTYGFPLDLAELVAGESFCTLDMEGFARCMGQQQERARQARRTERITVQVEGADRAETSFVGYDSVEPVEARLLQLIPQESGCFAVFERTPFYGEKGGQVGDRGVVTIDDRNYEVVDTCISAEGMILHKILEPINLLSVGALATLTVDATRRQHICCHHTATHILQAALRKVIGEHVKQAGSLVTEKFLRFDFSHFEGLSEGQLEAVEDVANAIVRQNISVCTGEMPFDQRPPYCLAHFGERYGARVRVVELGATQMAELCGGTHVRATGEIGLIKILSEGGIAAGTRRMEAIAGEAAQKFLGQIFRQFHRCACRLHCSMAEAETALLALQGEKQQREKQIKTLTMAQARQQIAKLLSDAREVCGRQWAVGFVDAPVDSGTLRSLAQEALKQKPNTYLLLLVNEGENFSYVIGFPSEGGISARQFIGAWNTIVHGNGGGNDTIVSGKCPVIENVSEAFLRFAQEMQTTSNP